ncbi:MAG: hypothetical protein ACXWQO_10265 [Bdellovibrionota bacterium]
MILDPELLADFVAEIKLLEPELQGLVMSLKKTCYDCAAATNKRPQVKELGLMENCMTNLGALIKSVHSTEEQKRIMHILHLECQRAKKLHEEVFQFTKKSA